MIGLPPMPTSCVALLSFVLVLHNRSDGGVCVMAKILLQTIPGVVRGVLSSYLLLSGLAVRGMWWAMSKWVHRRR